ncbi:pilus assembly PilX N-terminal domain-containing protein [Candidatus Parcubacteria bacterium]|nr:pilus assembly PilX N-terminal domain-containing protein [Candidatus Parcubacteria bacterium]
MQKKDSQKGVSLIIVFLIMTIIIAVVLSISTVLFDEVKIVSGIGNSVFSFYAVDTGIEKTLYFDRRAFGQDSTRGLCNICDSCNDPSVDPEHYCNNCTLTELAPGGCDASCGNCQVKYDSPFADDNYQITARTPSTDPDFNMDIKGFYKNVTRNLQIR